MSEDVLCALIMKFGITLVLAIAGVARSLSRGSSENAFSICECG